MLNKRFIIAFILALIALIVIGFIALNFVPTNDILDLNATALENVTDNATLNISEAQIDEALNNTAYVTANYTSADANDTNASSDIDPGDVLHKQTFTITGNETGQNEGMEPGTYVMYYTENDGIIKVEKI